MDTLTNYWKNLAESFSIKPKEMIAFSRLEEITKESFNDEKKTLKKMISHTKNVRDAYFGTVVIPYVEKKLKEKQDKKFSLNEIMNDFQIPADLKKNLVLYLNHYVQKKDNNLIAVIHTKDHMYRYQYNPDCATAMNKGNSIRKWLCYDNMCGKGNCRRIQDGN